MNTKLLRGLIFVIIVVTGCGKKEMPSPDPEAPSKPTIPVTTFSVSNVFQSNMVIQRDKPFQIWGQLAPGHRVTVTVSWNTTTFSVLANSEGIWKIDVPATSANNTAQSITCTTDGFAEISLKNILIGDVWVCSGQSNMTMPMDAISPFTGVLDYQTEISNSNYPNIRALTVSEDYQAAPLGQFSHPNNWVACSPETTGKISGVAYFFARKLNATLDIPVGIIVSSINGSWCESWMNSEAFNQFEVSNYSSSNNASKLYNGMISPLIQLQIKGFLWYQGENNQHIYPVSDYTRLNSALIKGWRTVFKNDQLPFYLVQLTPFAEDYFTTNPQGGDLTLNWLGYFREAQANVLSVPNTGMAVTMDVGEAANHHPRDKKPVGERLALLALKNTYGQNVICNGPKYLSHNSTGNTATINFVSGTADGLTTLNNQPLNQLFFVAGSDHIFRQGTAQINGNTIVVTAAASTPLPIQAIRYAFTNAAVTNLQNLSGLPMEPFRTDNW